MQCKSHSDGGLELKSHHVSLQEEGVCALQNVHQDFVRKAVSAV